ncbi:Uncharacterised protein [Dermatophilus congolensis]|uniref:Uncharacterized protein n=1 Tax=Dermatophilus congolensis TaxID=1863 RepID=A0AA46GZH9_9MICO|nr:Uncharacterised protein [Dermatophilus congolensis]
MGKGDVEVVVGGVEVVVGAAEFSGEAVEEGVGGDGVGVDEGGLGDVGVGGGHWCPWWWRCGLGGGGEVVGCG